MIKEELKQQINKLNKFEIEYLKGYIEGLNNNLSDNNLKIKEISEYLNIDESKITIVDGLVNVDGNVNLSERNLTELPFKFGTVTGHFNCSYNNLTSLEGAPQSVGGCFGCDNNNLTSLQGAPKTVGGWFDCSNNNLTNLTGAPQKVGGDFYCSGNKLTSLKGAPKEVGGNFYCSGNFLNYTKDQVRSMINIYGAVYGLDEQNEVQE